MHPEQKSHWDEVFAGRGAFFGEAASEFAKRSLESFQRARVTTLLELGCGQGRDALFFAGNAIDVTALDYSVAAVSALQSSAAGAGLASRIHAASHDVREPLPFPDETFDACYSHMLLCMEFSTAEIVFVLREIHRVLKPGGLALYSVRSNFDRHYRTGANLGEDLYAIGGFVVHFFSEGKIRELATGFKISRIDRMEEGHLPRDLFCVTLGKGPAPNSWELAPFAACQPEAPLDQLQRMAGSKPLENAPPEPLPGKT
jgi:SAM-dependent methyltransferase